MALQEDIKHYIESSTRKRCTSDDPKDIRIFDDSVQFVPIEKRPHVKIIEDRIIKIPCGDIKIRIYTPDDKKIFPLFIFFHGGGFIMGSIETHDVNCRTIANIAKCKVISVEYRLAPENPFPDGLTDCYGTVKWAYNNAEELSIDRKNITLGGDSSGGNLAASVSTMSRDNKYPIIAKQVLMYPVIGYFRKYLKSPYKSIEENKDYGPTSESMDRYWRYYIQNDSKKNNPYASLMSSKNLRGLPKTFIITGQYDALRDEGEMYGEKLKESGVNVTVKRYDGVIHGFLSFFKDINQAKDAYKRIASFINEK